MALVVELNDNYPIQCEFVATVRSKYADWRYTLDSGYIRYHIGSQVLYEHKLVAELIHGPKPHTWHVHHIDNNRRNNAWYNLVHLSPGDHAKMHKTDSYMVWCAQCQSELWINRTRISRSKSNQNFCNPDCYWQFVREHSPKPSKDVLARHLEETPNFCALGRMFGVSDNAVRKWAKSYGLDISRIDGRLKCASIR